MSRYSEVGRNVRPLESDERKERIKYVWKKYKPLCRNVKFLEHQLNKAVKEGNDSYALMLGAWIVDARREFSQT